MPDYFSGLSYIGPLQKTSMETQCKDHPNAGYRKGFGYAGGGYGPYKICKTCNTIFNKIDIGEG